MKKEYDNTELDSLIRESFSRQDIPSPVLNNSLKAELYSREAEMRKTASAKKLLLWYLPITVNLIIFLLLGVAAFVAISNPWLSFLVAGTCGYIALAGINHYWNDLYGSCCALPDRFYSARGNRKWGKYGCHIQ